MKKILKTLKTMSASFVRGAWCHRSAYAGLALITLAASCGVVDKAVADQVKTAIYVALVFMRH